MTQSTAPRVGVVELPALAAVLERAGLLVTTGEDFRTAATSVRRSLDETGRLPVFVYDKPWPGMLPWVERTAQATLVVVVHGSSGTGTAFTGVRSITLPCSVADIAAAGGLAVDPSLGELQVDLNGAIVGFGGAETNYRPSYTDAVAATQAQDEQVVDAPAPETTFEAPVTFTAVPAPAPSPAVEEPVAPRRPPFGSTPAAPAPVFTPVEEPPAPVFAVVEEPPPLEEEPAPPAPVFTPVEEHQAEVISLEDRARTTTFGLARREDLGEVIFVWAGKGGVGKTTTSMSMAQRAADAGKKVVLIDANFGQGDQRTFLRLGMAALPTIYNFAVDGDMRSAVIEPTTLNEARDIKAEPLGFGIVQAPTADLAGRGMVTPETYLRLVERLREVVDLVVIDTQIVEAVDPSGIVTRFLRPLMLDGAWSLGLSDLSAAGITNLRERIKAFAANGVPAQRMITTLNRVNRNVQFNADGISEALGEHSKFLGVVYADASIGEQMNRGRPVSNIVTIAPMFDAALSQVFGTTYTPPNGMGRSAAPSEEHGTRRRGLFRRRA